jgi:F-type H+-transporting ATPase subunit b
MVLAFVPLKRALLKALDTRSAQIAAELAEAKRLREEAQELLAVYQKKQQEALAEAEGIMTATKAEAELIAKQSKAELDQAIAKRKQVAMDKIAQAESKALQEVQDHVVDITVSVARSIITDHLARTGNEDIVRQAASELERKLH